MPQFPEAPRKTPIPSFAAYPVGYDVIRARLEPHLPSAEFSFRFSGLDKRLATNQDFTPITIFWLVYSPSKWREAHWNLYAYGAPRKEKAAIREALDRVGFQSLIEFMGRPRDPIWTDLAFNRSLVWHSGTSSLSVDDHSQIEGHKPSQSL